MEQLTPAHTPTDVTPPPTPEPISAADQAVTDGDLSAFREATRAERIGKPLPPAEPAKEPEPTPDPDPAAAPAPERQLSKRQQEVNDKIRVAVERATAEHQAEIARLRALVPSAPRSEPAKPAPAPMADPEPDPADATKYPEGQFDRQFIRDQAVWAARKEWHERDAAQRATQQQESSTRAIQERDRAWDARMDAVELADPTFWEKVTPAVRALRPFNALKEGERPSAHNVIAEEILRSPSGPQLMLHLSEHPQELTRLSGLRQADLLIELGELRASFKQPPSAPQTTTISAAPEPPTTLGSRSTAPADEVESAVGSNDFTGFRGSRLRARTAR